MKPKIFDLFNLPTRSASDLTHFLKMYGDGNMSRGVTRLYENGLGIGAIAGGVSVAGLFCLINGLAKKTRDKLKEFELEEELKQKSDSVGKYRFCVGDDI